MYECRNILPTLDISDALRPAIIIANRDILQFLVPWDQNVPSLMSRKDCNENRSKKRTITKNNKKFNKNFACTCVIFYREV